MLNPVKTMLNPVKTIDKLSVTILNSIQPALSTKQARPNA
jgi:hypothetical protein